MNHITQANVPFNVAITEGALKYFQSENALIGNIYDEFEPHVTKVLELIKPFLLSGDHIRWFQANFNILKEQRHADRSYLEDARPGFDYIANLELDEDKFGQLITLLGKTITFYPFSEVHDGPNCWVTLGDNSNIEVHERCNDIYREKGSDLIMRRQARVFYRPAYNYGAWLGFTNAGSNQPVDLPWNPDTPREMVFYKSHVALGQDEEIFVQCSFDDEEARKETSEWIQERHENYASGLNGEGTEPNNIPITYLTKEKAEALEKTLNENMSLLGLMIGPVEIYNAASRFGLKDGMDSEDLPSTIEGLDGITIPQAVLIHNRLKFQCDKFGSTLDEIFRVKAVPIGDTESTSDLYLLDVDLVKGDVQDEDGEDIGSLLLNAMDAEDTPEA